MDRITAFDELQTRIRDEEYLLVFMTSADCGVCHADNGRLQDLTEKLHFPCVRADIAEVPEAAGQLGVFSAPAVLLFYRGREYHRQAGFLDFARLETRMAELKGTDEMLKGVQK